MGKVQENGPRCFIYGLVDPVTLLVFYVGQTARGMSRPLEHRRKGWVFEVAILDVTRDAEERSGGLCPWLPPNRNPSLLNELERYWIALGRASGWPLRNKTDGGDGMRVMGTPSTRAKMSAAHLGKKHSGEVRAKISAANKARLLDPTANIGNAGNAVGASANAKAENLAGRKFGWLTVTGRAPNRGRLVAWFCVCDCGKTVTVTGYVLRKRGAITKSCGCLHREASAVRLLEIAHLSSSPAANAKRRSTALAKLASNPNSLDAFHKGRVAANMRRAVQSHCFAGHEFSVANTRLSPEGWRECRACVRERGRKRNVIMKASRRADRAMRP